MAGRVVDECWDFLLCGAVMVMQVYVYVCACLCVRACMHACVWTFRLIIKLTVLVINISFTMHIIPVYMYTERLWIVYVLLGFFVLS